MRVSKFDFRLLFYVILYYALYLKFVKKYENQYYDIDNNYSVLHFKWQLFCSTDNQKVSKQEVKGCRLGVFPENDKNARASAEYFAIYIWREPKECGAAPRYFSRPPCPSAVAQCVY